MRYLYLHGFASSPSSSKAEYFKQALGSCGVRLEVPTLVEVADFGSQTITKQMAVIEDRVGNEPTVLIGSSMGGYLAALYAASHASVARLLLLAPAFQFARLWEEELGPEEYGGWKTSGKRSVYHYGQGETIDVGFGLIEDALRYAAEPNFDQPALIFHGRNDTVVQPAVVEQFARNRGNVSLRMMDSDHQLTDQLDVMWREAKAFLLGREGVHRK